MFSEAGLYQALTLSQSEETTSAFPRRRESKPAPHSPGPWQRGRRAALDGVLTRSAVEAIHGGVSTVG